VLIVLVVLCVLGFSPSSVSASSLPPELEVKYSGFAFSGKYKDLNTNFPYTKRILDSSKDADGRTAFDKKLYEIFNNGKADIKNFKLILTEDTKTKISIAVAVTRERVDTIKFADCSKILASISLSIILLDFENMQVRSVYPFSFSRLDIIKDSAQTDEKSNSERIQKLFYNMYFADDKSMLSELKKTLPSIKVNKDGKLSIKVVDVKIEDDFKSKLPDFYKNNISAYQSNIAQRFSEQLVKILNMPVLPYAKDYLGAKMSISFSDAKTQDFIIPASSYGIDFTLRKLVKIKQEEGIGEDLYIYGAYTETRVYDPELKTEYWKEKVKHGEGRAISTSRREFDDFADYDDVTTLAIKDTIEQMKEDKKMKEVIEKCSRN